MSRLVLVTIVAEAEVGERLLRDLDRVGVRGWNTTEGEGTWHRAWDRDGPPDFQGRTLRIELVASPAMAETVMARLAAAWFPHYAVFAWTAEVDVMRPAKYD